MLSFAHHQHICQDLKKCSIHDLKIRRNFKYINIGNESVFKKRRNNCLPTLNRKTKEATELNSTHKDLAQKNIVKTP